MDKKDVTQRMVLEYKISQAVNQWLHKKGADALKYVNYMDRVAELSMDVIRPAIADAEAIWHKEYDKPIFFTEDICKE